MTFNFLQYADRFFYRIGFGFIKARYLLHKDRLDIIVKYLFLKYSLEKHPSHLSKKWKDVYDQSIYHRVDSKEDDKKSIKDFHDSFLLLNQSIKEKGFKVKHRIYFQKAAENMVNKTGAHRLASSLYNDRGVFFKLIEAQNLSKRLWGSEWFEKYFDQSIIDELFLVYSQQNPSRMIPFVVWPHAHEKIDEIKHMIAQQKLTFVHSKELNLSDFERSEVVKDFYPRSSLNLSKKILDKAINIANKRAPITLLLFQSTHPCDSINWNSIKNLKKSIRELCQDVTPIDKFMTIHTPDSVDEASYICEYFLSPYNIKMLKLRSKSISQEFDGWLLEFFNAIKKKRIRAAHACVVGSSSLEVLGIRKSTDIDFVITHNIRFRRLLRSRAISLSDNVDVASKNYGRSPDLYINDDELISNANYHFYYRGAKFSNIEIIESRKALQRREKDLKDVDLIKAWQQETKA